jgi:hypothetical protein
MVYTSSFASPPCELPTAIHRSAWKVNMRKKKGRRLSAPADILNELCARVALVVLLGRLLDRRGRLAQLLRAHDGMDLYGRS